MKKVLIPSLILMAIFMMPGCQKNSPTASAATETPTNVEGTVVAVLTNAAIANATKTKVAQETATAAAGLYTPTITSTITPSPNHTATAAAVIATQTAVAVAATQTAVAVVATQTAIAAIPYTNLASVPGGTYTQTDGTNSFSHTISTFKMGKYQVTYDLWYAVYKWAVANGYTFQDAGAEGCCGTAGAAPTTAKYQPVTTINWRDAIVWCNAYSQETGLTPCYTYSSAVIKNSTNATACDNAVCAWTNNGYRLPSEGEYQYAASYKDGTNWTPYNYASGATADYNDATATGLVAWYSANCSSTGSTQIVGGKTENALDIYDMSGNVWEWCWDWYGTYPGTSTDYRGRASGSSRMMRGGSFYGGADKLRVGYRYYDIPSGAYSGDGFRFARTN